MSEKAYDFYWVRQIYESGDYAKLREVLDCDRSALKFEDRIDGSLLNDAIGAQDLIATTLFLSRGANPNGISVGESPIVSAVEASRTKSDTTFVAILLAAGADIEKSSCRGTALHAATKLNNLIVAEFLLNMGANVNCTSADDGPTPLWFAAFARNVDMVKLLLRFGADTTIRDTTLGLTPYQVANRKNDGSSMLLKELLSG